MPETIFKRYRKTTPTIARVLTETDYARHKGTILTHEGPAPFLPGDYLAKDDLGVWPIRIETIRANYGRVGTVDTKGFMTFCPLDTREAAQLTEPQEVNGLRGEVGDYLVSSGQRRWIVARSVFEQAYTLVGEESKHDDTHHANR